MECGPAMLTLEPLRELSVPVALHPRGQGFLSSASGLVCALGCAYVVADDEHHLAVFRDAHSQGQWLRLIAGDLPAVHAERKRRKPDLESLVLLAPGRAWPFGALLALGSGSSQLRESGILCSLAANGDPRPGATSIDLRPLYTPLRNRFDDLNIEGAFVSGRSFILLQRGNRSGSANAALHYRSEDLIALIRGRAKSLQPFAEINYDLGQLDGVPLCFTDGAALPDGRWVFTAVAEDSGNSYADGPCLASAIGVVDAQGALLAIHRLAGAEKVEGIAVQVEGDAIELCLVSDADDPQVPSCLWRTRLAR